MSSERQGKHILCGQSFRAKLLKKFSKAETKFSSKMKRNKFHLNIFFISTFSRLYDFDYKKCFLLDLT